jgi:hypothetical protein
MPLPSVATFRRTQRMVSCASSQFIANNKSAFESGPNTSPSANLVKLPTPFTPEPPKPSGLEVLSLREEQIFVSL